MSPRDGPVLLSLMVPHSVPGRGSPSKAGPHTSPAEFQRDPCQLHSKLSALVKCILMAITEAKCRQLQTIGIWMFTVCLHARGTHSHQSGRLTLQPTVRCHHQGFLGEVLEQGKVQP